MKIFDDGLSKIMNDKFNAQKFFMYKIKSTLTFARFVLTGVRSITKHSSEMSTVQAEIHDRLLVFKLSPFKIS